MAGPAAEQAREMARAHWAAVASAVEAEVGGESGWVVKAAEGSAEEVQAMDWEVEAMAAAATAAAETVGAQTGEAATAAAATAASGPRRKN